MFAVFEAARGLYTINLEKILFFYPCKHGTRLEMEDGTLIDVKNEYNDVNDVLRGYNALKSRL